MRKLIYILSSLLYLVNYVGAQEGNKISSLKAPSSPSSFILGIQPSSITRPKSWEALETAVFTNFLDSSNNLIIPNNFALEFSPFWATKDRKVKIEDFLVPTIGQTLMQNLSLSVSSSKSFIINDSVKSNAIGFGIRTMLWQGTKDEKALITLAYKDFLTKSLLNVRLAKFVNDNKLVEKANKQEYIDAIIKYITENKENLLKDMDKKYRSKWIAQLKDHLNSKDFELIKSSFNDCMDEYTKIDSALIDIENYRADRKGFKLEIAAATALNFPTSDVNLSYGSKYSFWLTPSFQPAGKNFNWLEFIGVLRYTAYNGDFYKRYDAKEEFFSNNADYGLKLVLKWKRISLDFEAIGRRSQSILSQTTDLNGNTITISKSRDDSQYIASISYKIDENISLSYNFGKQFEPVINYKGNLISVINLNFGFGAPTKKNIE